MCLFTRFLDMQKLLVVNSDYTWVFNVKQGLCMAKLGLFVFVKKDGCNEKVIFEICAN